MTGSSVARTGAPESLIFAMMALTGSPVARAMSTPSIRIVASACTRYCVASTVE